MKKNAFTLVELLIVIAVISILASILLVSVSQAKQRARIAECSGNVRSLVVSWEMYSDDHADRLLINKAIQYNQRPREKWINGIMNFGEPGWGDHTNSAYVQHNLMFEYAPSLRMYKCPSDKIRNFHYVDRKWQKIPWVRTYGLNQYMNGTPIGKYSNYLTQNHIDEPSNRMTFLGQRADTYENGFFVVGVSDLFVPEAYRWHEFPAKYHIGKTPVAMADGHTEIHKWETQWPPMGNKKNSKPREHAPNSSDIGWINNHATAIK